MRQLVVLSGKGGTGKTSVVACFAALSGRAVLADCDVDAADLHLILEPSIRRRQSFSGGKRAEIAPELCTSCGKCAEICRFGAIRAMETNGGSKKKTYRVDPIACEGCGVCVWFCPERAIAFEPAVNGEWFVSETRHGPMVHASLGVAEENSGKLVSTVRQEARRLAELRGLELVIVDGSPGIGCPVIASISGASLVLIVTEPTLSGLHDLERVAELTRHFGVPAKVSVNKWDLNPRIAARIEDGARSGGLGVAGRVRYDRAVTEAQIRKLAVVELKQDGSAEDIRQLWADVQAAL
jgi:MinD superfamily P-loop ATPase